MTPPYFCTFVIISPLKRTWPFISNLNSLHLFIQEWFVWSSIEIAHLVLEKTISNINIYVKIVLFTMAPPHQRGPWFEQDWISIMSWKFHVNLRFSVPKVLKNNIVKQSHHKFAFCDYLPFEEDLALYLNNL
jgi:hypothetical protein